MGSRSTSTTSLRKRSLPMALPLNQSAMLRGYRRPSVPVNLAHNQGSIPSFVAARKLSPAEADLLQIKSALG